MPRRITRRPPAAESTAARIRELLSNLETPRAQRRNVEFAIGDLTCAAGMWPYSHPEVAPVIFTACVKSKDGDAQKIVAARHKVEHYIDHPEEPEVFAPQPDPGEPPPPPAALTIQFHELTIRMWDVLKGKELDTPKTRAELTAGLWAIFDEMRHINRTVVRLDAWQRSRAVEEHPDGDDSTA